MKTATDIYVSPKGFHRHQCHKCKVIWEHGDSEKGSDAAHACPNGCTSIFSKAPQMQFSRYNGIEPPNTIFNDYPALPDRKTAYDYDYDY